MDKDRSASIPAPLFSTALCTAVSFGIALVLILLRQPDCLAQDDEPPPPEASQASDEPDPFLPPTAVQAFLEQLAREVAYELNHPSRNKLRPGRLSHDYWRSLSLAAVWPRSEFIPGLTQALDSQDLGHVTIAAAGLLNYGHAGLRARVEALADDGRMQRAGCFVWRLGNSIQRIIAEHHQDARFRRPERSLVPLDEFGINALLDDKSTAMTIDHALSALGDADVSIRLQAFLWLAYRGIVVDTRPLNEAWSQLTNREREATRWSFSSPWRVGQSLLKASLERILRRCDDDSLDDDVLGGLLTASGGLESEYAREVALSIIEKHEREPRDWDFDTGQLLSDALRAFASPLKTADATLAFRWASDERHMLRNAGFYILAHFDDPAAVQAVTAFLESESVTPTRHTLDLDPVSALAARTWSDAKVKWHYVRALVTSLERLTEANEDSFWPEPFVASGVIAALESITGVTNGDARFCSPSGYSIRELQEVSANWTNWLTRGNPVQR